MKILLGLIIAFICFYSAAQIEAKQRKEAEDRIADEVVKRLKDGE